MQDRNIREYMTTVKCSVCGQFYELDDVSVLGHQDEVWFLSVFCKTCNTHGLVAALVKEAGKGRRPSEPIEGEHRGVEDTGPITFDDVLDMHNFLLDFDGDFASLLGKD
jgi:hypothetical protein